MTKIDLTLDEIYALLHALDDRLENLKLDPMEIIRAKKLITKLHDERRRYLDRSRGRA